MFVNSRRRPWPKMSGGFRRFLMLHALLPKIKKMQVKFCIQNNDWNFWKTYRCVVQNSAHFPCNTQNFNLKKSIWSLFYQFLQNFPCSTLLTITWNYNYKNWVVVLIFSFDGLIYYNLQRFSTGQFSILCEKRAFERILAEF